VKTKEKIRGYFVYSLLEQLVVDARMHYMRLVNHCSIPRDAMTPSDLGKLTGLRGAVKLCTVGVTCPAVQHTIQKTDLKPQAKRATAYKNLYEPIVTTRHMCVALVSTLI